MRDRADVTLSDVAAHAGVSLATASRALNGSDRRVRPEYVARVIAAAEELRYSPNVQAQAMARGMTTTLALVVGDVADPYFSSVAAGAIRAADDAGLVVTMTATGGDPDHERAALGIVQGLRPRAVVVAVSRRTASAEAGAAAAGERAMSIGALGELAARGTGVVVLGSDDSSHDAHDSSHDAHDSSDDAHDRGHDDRGHDAHDGGRPIAGARTLVIRNRAGAADLADALFDRGYRDFAVLAGDPGLVTPRARADGFVTALGARGVDVQDDRFVHGPFSRDGGHDAMEALLTAGVRPSCVFAVTDVMAVGALAAIREHGLEPGRDVAVAGFDDIRMLADIVPALTTVRLPLEEIGAAAVRLALGVDTAAAVSGTVVLRASTPPVG